jgi:hypothetical protein
MVQWFGVSVVWFLDSEFHCLAGAAINWLIERQ